MRESVDMHNHPGNRKAIGWVFVGTGILSLVLWWWGSRNKSRLGDWILPLTVSYDVEVTPTKELIRPPDVTSLTSDKRGTYAWYVHRLNTGENYGEGEETILPAASIMKVPMMVTALKAVDEGRLKLEDIYTLEGRDKRTGSGPISTYANGTKLSIATLLSEMGKKSDNTAAAAVTRMLGKEAIVKTMLDLGMDKSSFEEYTTTAKDAAEAFVKLYESDYLSTESKALLWEYLKESIYEDRIPAGVPDTAEVIHKVGTDINVWIDVGIIRCPERSEECAAEPFVMAVLNDGVRREEAEAVVPEITRMIWEFEVKNS